MNKKRILHIMPHMGGGAGRVISGIVGTNEDVISHTILLLEQPIDTNFYERTSEIGVNIIIQPANSIIWRLVEESNITIIHWWHHPKIAKLLYDFPNIVSRIVFWTHISSLTVPALSPQLLMRSSMVWFTSHASYDASVFMNIPKEIIEKKVRVVYGCAGLDNFPNVEHEAHDGYNIGYLGYVDFSKLHSEFISFCKEVCIPEARFILVGDSPAKDILKKQIQEQKVKNEFAFLGYMTNISNILSKFDVLGYPLMPFHTCTTENVILEAMAAKVPPVLLRQLSEQYIIKDGETGILVSNKEEYGSALRYLYNNPKVRAKMGMQAREFVMQKYSNKILIQAFYSAIEAVMEQPKKKMYFKDVMGHTPAEWFLSCLGQDKNKFRKSFLAGTDGQTDEIKKSILDCSPLLKGNNKSSVFHYAKEFPNDQMLKIWASIIREERENNV